MPRKSSVGLDAAGRLQAVKDYLTKSGPSTTAEIAAGLGWDEGIVKNVLYTKQDQFVKTEKGGRHHPHKWSLPD